MQTEYVLRLLQPLRESTRAFLCSPGYPGTSSVDQAGLELKDPPASASQLLGSKAGVTSPGGGTFLIITRLPLQTLRL